MLRAALVIYVLTPVVLDRPPARHARAAFRWSEQLRPWSMAEIFAIGCAVALVKLSDLALVGFGPAFWLFTAVVIIIVLQDRFLCSWSVWNSLDPRKIALTAREAGLVGCRRCAKVWPMGTETCARCGTVLESRDRASLQKVWAWWFAGVLAYIPANLYPMLRTRTLFTTSEDTIVGGAVELLLHGSVGVAIIILIASVMIPIGKFIAIAFLALSVGRARHMSAGTRTHLYEVVEFIGRWSMIDVFVVAILASLVQLNVIGVGQSGPREPCLRAFGDLHDALGAGLRQSPDLGPDRRG